MSTRLARALALSASTVVAVATFFIVRPLLHREPQNMVQIHEMPRDNDRDADGAALIQAFHPSVDPATTPSNVRRPIGTEGFARTSDPDDPREWIFYLNERQVGRFFYIAGDTRMVYDPWSYVRDRGDQRFEFTWKEHPKGRWIDATNHLGCREDHELDDPPRELRVLVAGDSHTCGVCDNDESFCNVLEAQLAADRPGHSVEVLNAGLGGYSFFNYLGTYFRFREFKPQVFVVAVFGGNDFNELVPLYLHFAGKQWEEKTPLQVERTKAGLHTSGDAMGQGLACMDFFRSWPRYRPVIIRAAVQSCVEMKRVAEKGGSKFVLVYIPCPFDFVWPDPPKPIEETRKALQLTDDDTHLTRAMAEEFLEGVRAQGIEVLDLYPIFAKEPVPPYWRRDFHLNLRGHQLTTQALKPLVERLLPPKH